VLRVLIADDSLGFGALAQAWLKGSDEIEVVGAAHTAEHAIETIRETAPDVVVLDRLLPQPEDSEQVLDHVRRTLPETAVLLVSGMPDDMLAAEARAAGADHYVSKAANPETLLAAVRAAAAARARR
jgi:DNA-binding NarL/FixJ family response regulator